LSDIKQFGMSRGDLAKIRNINFHEISFSTSRDVTFRRTDRKEERTSFSYFSIPNSHKPPQNECILLLIAALKQSAFHIQRLTAKHIYCTNIVQSATELYFQ